MKHFKIRKPGHGKREKIEKGNKIINERRTKPRMKVSSQKWN